MEEYQRHEFRAEQLERKPDPYLYDIGLVRSITTLDPAPGVKDYSVLSRGVAQVRGVDQVRANAEAWETANPVP